ncbi:MAG: ATP-binding protein [Peptococcaceae bacterium]|nr:ATP-binding protein [Peptococcaceae bacterium]
MLESVIRDRARAEKVIVLLGARQVGKATLIRSMFGGDDSVLWLSGDESEVRALFEDADPTRLRAMIGGKTTVVIDEAQRVADIGVKLKLITDQMPDVRLVTTGSLPFDTGGPPAERSRELVLYPMSFEERAARHGRLDEVRLTPRRLVYGCYPEVVASPGNETEVLRGLCDNYLYKDILALNKIRKYESMARLLKALASQIGSKVSYCELGVTCGLDSKTVEKYVMVLEEAYIVFRLGTFARRIRNELKISRKVFFVDNGVRNALISDFRPAEEREDIGQLWENFMISERVKRNSYRGGPINSWFWRTRLKREIDYIEERNERFSAYEFKWNPAAKAKVPRPFPAAYPNSDFTVVHPDNFVDFLL